MLALTDQEVADCLGRSLDAAGNILPRTFAREVLRAAHSPCRFASQCSEEGSCTNGCEARAPVAYLRPISQPDWLEVCQKGEPGAFPVYSKEAVNVVASQHILQLLADAYKEGYERGCKESHWI